MTGLFAALLVFATVAGLVAVYRADDDSVSAFAAEPKRVPDPGPRDLYAVTGGLGRAHVPSWG